LRGDVSVNPVKGLTVMGYVSVLGGMMAQNHALQAVTLGPNIDLGFNAEYQLVSRLSAFVELDNLLNSKYERWLGYQAYGLNAYGGLRLKF
jgi:outer membrane cobalamin receptor